MPEMNIIVRDKIATKTDTVNYVCGNSDYVVNFDFDSEWDAYDTKTAQFNVNGKHIPVVFTGNQCKVPVITNTYAFHVGVFAGDLHTTTAARVPCKKSILCDSGAPADPPDDVYNQIMEKLNKMETGTDDHTQLTNRDTKNQHPQSAITGLLDDLGAKLPAIMKGRTAWDIPNDINFTNPPTVLNERIATQKYVDEKSAFVFEFDGSAGDKIDEKLAEEIMTAFVAGRPVYCFYNGYSHPLLTAGYDEVDGYLFAFSIAGSNGKSVLAENLIVIFDQWHVISVNIATLDDIPDALKNPYALTINIGGKKILYDGTLPQEITIPEGGGSSGGETWELINTFEVAEADAARVIKIDKDSNGNAFSLKAFAFSAKTNSTKTDASLFGWFCVNGNGNYNSGVGGFQTNYVRHPSTGAAIYNDVIGRVLPFGLVYDHTTGRKAPAGVQNRTIADVHEVELAGYQYAENQLYGTFQLWGVRK